uniref:Germane domain-containing protein n=1 Tax=Strongyloides papillosus TaxID=174720 RepID=A0A0N5CFL2_STREA
MQFFKFFLFAALIITINACAPTNTQSAATTTAPKRKRRSVDEDNAVVIKTTFDSINRTKAHQIEGLLLDKFASSLPAASSNIDRSTKLTNIEDGKLTTTITFHGSSNLCSKIIRLIKDTFNGNVFVKNTTIKCGNNETISIIN